MPQTESALLSWPLRALTRLVLRFPVPTIALGLVAAVAALVLAGTRLGFRPSRLDLLNPGGYNRLWIDYIEEFGDEDDVVVVVDGPSRELVVPVLEEVSTALVRHHRLFHAVLHEVDLSKIRGKGLHYLPPEELLRIEQFVGKVGPIIHGQWAALNLRNLLGGLAARQMASAQSPEAQTQNQAELARLADSILAALSGRGQYQSPWPEPPCSLATLNDLNSEYLLTNEGRLGFVLLRLAKNEEKGFALGTTAIDTLRRLIAETQSRHPQTRIGLTGLPVMENDEMRCSQISMTHSNLLSFFGVALLYVAGFGGLRHPLMGVASLLLAMVWSFGYITLSVGHINILSMAFGAMLIGLGDDYGIHYVARYLQLRRSTPSADDALLQTASSIGPGALTGAMTTAVAFFMAGLTDFKGVAELGVIAGGGILLCWFAAVTILPAMIHLSDANRPDRPLPAPLDIPRCLTPVYARPRTVLVLGLAATGLVSLGLSRLWYDHNLLNLQPEGLESVELEQKLLSRTDQSVWFALSIAESAEELLARKAKFLEKPSVQRCEEIASLLPINDPRKPQVIERIQRHLDGLPERPPRIPIDAPADLGLVLARIQGMLAQDSRYSRIERQFALARDALRQMPLSECYARLCDYQQRMAGDLLNRLHVLRSVANPQPPQLTDLPEGLVTRFVGQRGRFLLKIYGKGNLWDMDAMERFVRDVRSVDKHATGNPLQTYEASRQMKRSYEQAALFALMGIIIVIYLDFRSLAYTFMALVPLAVGMLQTFGILGLLGIPLNPANMVSLPLILGIGVESGVHVLHDFRCQKGPYRLSSSTGFAVMLMTLTTMVGFASLMIASHRGLQSLGRVLTIGMSCCLFSSLVLLPALLVLVTRNRVEPEPEEPPEEPIVPRRTHRQDRAHYPDTGSYPLTSPHRRRPVAQTHCD